MANQRRKNGQRNDISRRYTDKKFNLLPDPDGFFGCGDWVERRLGSRVGTRTKTESVSGFLQALFVVPRLRRIEGQATAAFGLCKENHLKHTSLICIRMLKAILIL